MIYNASKGTSSVGEPSLPSVNQEAFKAARKAAKNHPDVQSLSMLILADRDRIGRGETPMLDDVTRTDMVTAAVAQATQIVSGVGS